MCGSMVDIQSATAEIRRGKDRKKKKETTGCPHNKMSASVTQSGHSELLNGRKKKICELVN